MFDPRRKPRRRLEDDIQRAVFLHLRARGAPNMVYFHVPNGGKRSRVEAAILKGLGVTPGIPDVCIIKDGQVFMPELKPETGGRLRPSQRDMLAALERAGAHTAVCYGLDHALAVLETWGLLRGRTEFKSLGDVGQRVLERTRARMQAQKKGGKDGVVSCVRHHGRRPESPEAPGSAVQGPDQPVVPGLPTRRNPAAVR